VIGQIVESVELARGEIRIALKRDALLGMEGEDDQAASVVISVSGQVTRRGMANRVVVEGATGGSTPNEPLIRAIACGRAWFEELASGRASSFGEIAARVGVTDRYVSRIVDLAFLAPDVAETMLNGEQPVDVTVRGLTVDGSVPMPWHDQRRSLLDVR
jgi:hypothetical protein